MTLTEALNLALDPATKEEGLKALKAISHFDDYEQIKKPTPIQSKRAICAGVILWMLGAAPELGPQVSRCMQLLVCVGADLSGTQIVNGQPDWSATMPRLAAWADLLGVEQ